MDRTDPVKLGPQPLHMPLGDVDLFCDRLSVFVPLQLPDGVSDGLVGQAYWHGVSGLV